MNNQDIPLIFARIDVTKVDKAKLYQGKESNGHTPKYLDVALMPSKPQADGSYKYDQHYMVVQSVSKEERASGVRGAILGNGKIHEFKAVSQQKPKPTPASAAPTTEDSDDVPF